ncbi:hypothetical protein D3C71_1556420 [compost metagenome]
MKSRLKKVALMAPDVFQKQVDQISDKGRDILKAIEDYKFFVEQVSRVVKNDPGLTQMITNKKKNLDQASQQIYDVVFDIENMDITTTYYNQQQATELSKEPTPKPPTPGIGNPAVPDMPPPPPVNPQEQAAPGNGTPPTPTPALAPGKPEDKVEDKEEVPEKQVPKEDVDKEKGDSSKDE